jgi:hypothetical protein
MCVCMHVHLHVCPSLLNSCERETGVFFAGVWLTHSLISVCAGYPSGASGVSDLGVLGNLEGKVTLARATPKILSDQCGYCW